jgi:ParB family transcriptional regulator, chromosome partitioning protein
VETLQQTKLEVVEVELKKIRTRIRLRTPDESKIFELAESIKTAGLIHPITIDTENYLVAGYHRKSAYEYLGFTTIPCIISDTSKIINELKECDENLKINTLDHIQIGEHLKRREEIFETLGMRMKKGNNQYSEGLISTNELAEQIGVSNRMYRLKRMVADINIEAKELLKGTQYARVLNDMVKLCREPDSIQLEVANLLVTGECRSFKRAFAVAAIADFREEHGYQLDFSVKERWNIPQTIMKFKNADSKLQKVCDLISKSEELNLTKRADFTKGQSDIPIYGMSADLAEFLVTYYTPEGGLVLDQFSGRFTIGLAALLHGRSFVGYDLSLKNCELFEEVAIKHIPDSANRMTVHHSDGVYLKEYSEKSEYFDAIICDPPYVKKAERYSEDEREIGNMSHNKYMELIKRNFQECYRLIKKSNWEEKIFHPVIYKVGSGRRGKYGITCMDFDFQLIAREIGFVLHDKLINQLNTPFAAVNFQRNYINKMVQKNYEVNLVFCRFD